VVVVDDHSSDRTKEVAEGLGATVIRHEVNRGVGAAIRSGILFVRDAGCDAVVILSGDDQHEPSELPRVLEPIHEGRFDFVQGSRRLPGGRAVGINAFRRVTTFAYALVFRLVTGFPCTDATNGFRAFRLSMIDDPQIRIEQEWLDRYELEPYLLYKAVKTGKRICEVPITIRYHDQGTTKMRPVRDWWLIFRPLVYLALGMKQ